MKKKYYILTNSIAYQVALAVEVADYTDSDLSDQDIEDELHDRTVELEQQCNVMIIPADEIPTLIEFV